MLRPLPGIRRCRSACWYHPARPVPPSRFLTVSAVFSAASPAGLFHPAPAMGFTTLPVSPCTRRRSAEAELTIPVVHDPSEVCPCLQPCRVTTAVSTLTLRPATPGTSSALIPRNTPDRIGKLEPTEMGLHVPAAPWSATTADESTAMQICNCHPKPEGPTCAVARSPSRPSPQPRTASASEQPGQSGRLRGVSPLTST
jgi:hypothetical protein